MCSPIVELKFGDKVWAIYDDGSQQGFPTGTIIKVHPPFRDPEVVRAAQRANERFEESGRVL